MIVVDKKFLHISLVGTFIMAIITPGIPGLIWSFMFGLCLGQGIKQSRKEK